MKKLRKKHSSDEGTLTAYCACMTCYCSCSCICNFIWQYSGLSTYLDDNNGCDTCCYNGDINSSGG